MRIYNIVLILMVLNLFLSCSTHDNGTGGVDSILQESQIITLKEKSINGDSLAYNELMSIYIVNLMYEEAFRTSFIVANRYNNSQAYFMLFWSIAHSVNSKEDLDINQRIFELANNERYYCIYYLLKSSELGYEEAKIYHKEFFLDKGIVINSNQLLDSLKNGQ